MKKYHDLAKFENGIAVSEEGAKMGLMNGDKILKIDGKPAERPENSLINMFFLPMKLQFLEMVKKFLCSKRRWNCPYFRLKTAKFIYKIDFAIQ